MIIPDKDLNSLIDRQSIVADNEYGDKNVRLTAQNLIYALRELRARRDADDVVKEASVQQERLTSGHVEEVKKPEPNTDDPNVIWGKPKDSN